MADVATKNKASSVTIFDVPRDRLWQAQRAYVAFFKAYFAGRPAGNFRWLANGEESEIRITSQAPVHIDAPHTRPILSVVRAQAGFGGISMSGITEEKMLSRERTYKDTINATMVINCLAKEGPEAEALAYLCALGLKVFRLQLHRAGRIHGVGNQVSLGPISAPGNIVQGSSTSEWRLVQVFSPFHLVEEIQVSRTQDAEFEMILEKILIETKT